MTLQWRARLTSAFAAVTLAFSLLEKLPGSASPSPFCAAYYHPERRGPVLTLLPLDGPSTDVALPPGLPGHLVMNPFSPDGRALFIHEGTPVFNGLDKLAASPFPVNSLVKVEFKPARQTLVPGSAQLNLGWIWRLTLSRPPGPIFVSGGAQGRRECGAFEIDPGAGSSRTLVSGTDPDCGEGAGPISPDGGRLLTYSGGELRVMNLKTGASQIVSGLGPEYARFLTFDQRAISTQDQGARWSPDGKWIALVLEGRTIVDSKRIVLVDANEPSNQKGLGQYGGGYVSWSPDSKYLLLYKKQPVCIFNKSLTSLEVLDVSTGKRRVIPSSRCKISDFDWIGWVDRDAIQ